MADQQLYLIVRNREGIVFEGEVKSLTAKNRRGKFDVLPLHGNFISLFQETLVIGKADGSTQEVTVGEGVLRVVRNRVEVLLGVRV